MPQRFLIHFASIFFGVAIVRRSASEAVINLCLFCFTSFILTSPPSTAFFNALDDTFLSHSSADSHPRAALLFIKPLSINNSLIAFELSTLPIDILDSVLRSQASIKISFGSLAVNARTGLAFTIGSFLNDSSLIRANHSRNGLS
jgi:hypothetical protein